MEEFDEKMITTGIDKFVELIYKRKRVGLNEASKALNIPINTLEFWCYVLENNGLIKIEYTLTETYVEWVGSG
jgi:predicted transcriptional regulator